MCERERGFCEEGGVKEEKTLPLGKFVDCCVPGQGNSVE